MLGSYFPSCQRLHSGEPILSLFWKFSPTHIHTHILLPTLFALNKGCKGIFYFTEFCLVFACYIFSVFADSLQRPGKLDRVWSSSITFVEWHTRLKLRIDIVNKQLFYGCQWYPHFKEFWFFSVRGFKIGQLIH